MGLAALRRRRKKENIPIPRKKRYTTSAVSRPLGLPPAPYDAVPRMAKRMMIMVEVNSDHFLEK